MREKLLTLLGIGACLLSVSAHAQVVEDFVVKATVSTQTAPPSIKISFPKDPSATSYSIFRKTPESGAWGTMIVSLGSNDSTWTDNTVTLGQAYEYKIQKNRSTFNAVSCLQSAVQLPARHNRGIVILAVDSSLADSLVTEISRLKDDLIGDGWTVKTIYIDRAALPPYVKDRIKAVYNENTAQTKSLFLLGHIPVAYSGGFGPNGVGDFPYAPDGHSDHIGAWPADVYYGDFKGTWTDQNYDNSDASRPANHNTPGDGKFDRASLYSDLVTQADYDSMMLEIGRVDLSNMPAFGVSEVELMRRYLNKDHQFRMKTITAAEKAVIDDNFGVMSGEVFSASGWRAFTAMFGAENVRNDDYFTASKSEAMLWGYACGGGTYTSAGGVGNTANFVNDTAQVVFNMLFGSYFGDWNSENNFLRAPLASGTHGLINAWSGRPHWQFFPMAIGQTAGYCARITQNNNAGTGSNSLYTANAYWSGVHVALMGDPTLRLHILEPVATLNTSGSGTDSVNLSWTASADAQLGYYIYRKSSTDAPFELLNNTPVNGLSFTDNDPWNGTNIYMIRAAKMQTSASGTYENLSQGTFSTINGIVSGKYPAGIDAAEVLSLNVYPNPAQDAISVNWTSSNASAVLSLLDVSGKTLRQQSFNGENSSSLDVSQLSAGIYLIQLETGGIQTVKKLVIR